MFHALNIIDDDVFMKLRNYHLCAVSCLKVH